MKLNVTWRGLDETQRALDALMAAVGKNVAQALEHYGQTATEQMKADHDRDAHDIQRYVNRTWYLTGSIAYDTAHPEESLYRLQLHARAWYAGFVEQGTARSQPYPFFWPAVYGLEEQGRTEATMALLTALEAHEAGVRGGGATQVAG